jgi:subtilisin family serine protease
MRAWQAGIVVVAAAGNRGPDPMTIGVPGNVPYIITVGAVSDNYTPANNQDDFLTSFSSTGPTVEGFVKPEVIAPGGHMLGLMDANTTIGQSYGRFRAGTDEFVMSGTSQASAVIAGLAALILEQNPTLTPDQVKYRLMAASTPAVNAGSQLAYSVFQQGAGLPDVQQAVFGTTTTPANQGLNVAQELAGMQHYGGYANRDANGNYYLMDVNGMTWGTGYAWNGSYTWNSGFSWSSSYTWQNAFSWNTGFSWTNSYTWQNAFSWGTAWAWSNALINTSWVPQE